jgi:S1-C subfamily serine protease
MNKLLICTILSFIASNVQAQSFEKVRAITVLVTNEGLGGSGRGTGVLLDATHVLTCAHMVSGQADMMLVYTYPMAHVYIAKPDAVDRSDDLAILVLDSSAPVKQAPVFYENVPEGSPITIIGNVLGSMKWYVTHGVITGTDGPYLLTDGAILPGNSGGPWVNEKGHIVALTDWALHSSDGTATGINGGVSATTINRFLENYKMSSFLAKMLDN